MKTQRPHSYLRKITVGFICISLLVLLPHLGQAEPGSPSEPETPRNSLMAAPLHSSQGIVPQNDLWGAGETSHVWKGLRRDDQMGCLKTNYYYYYGPPILIANRPVSRKSDGGGNGKILFEKYCVMCHGNTRWNFKKISP